MKGKSTSRKRAISRSPKISTVMRKTSPRKASSSKKPGKRVFVSFDFDKDKTKKNLLVGQSRNKRTPFKISDYSLKEAAPDKRWENKARKKIRRSEKVVVLLGKQTYRSSGVKKEVKIARQEKKPIVQLASDPKAKSVPKAGKRRKWNWDNLNKELR